MNANINSASHLEPAGSKTDHTSEAVDWESRYRVGDTPWEKGCAAPPLVDFLEHHPILGSVMVPGCGSGHDVRALSLQGAKAVGLDVAESAIAAARAFSFVSGESYEHGDLFTLPQSWNRRFDWVVEHTCFCAIDPALRAEYIQAVTQVLKPGGHYFAIFFMTPDSEQGPPFGVTKNEISMLFDSNFELLKEWVPPRTFEGREDRELCQLRKLRKD